MTKRTLIDVAHITSRGTSYRITIPQRVVKKLNLGPEDIVAFYDDDGVKIDKLQ
ncbi:MAG: AbrB/MazE/SpoVT family DNA-binding domain-containing protein [Thermoplasmataceae archaeon]|jgi:bifunctional DNA-binding transcriptional regulator/antitoxin component of YhaV-PrlF toxin-antitoxin module